MAGIPTRETTVRLTSPGFAGGTTRSIGPSVTLFPFASSRAREATGRGSGAAAAFTGQPVTNDAGSQQLQQAPPPAALTASVAGTSAEHRGKGTFPLRIAFSEAVVGKVRDAAATIQITGGTLTRAQRAGKRKDLWELRIAPSGHAAVTLVLPATPDCAARGAVRYRTKNGRGRAGRDFEAAKGTLAFAAGGTAKTVSVVLLDDAKDKGEETFTLVLTKPKGAVIADGEETGSIENDDPMPSAWLARFGRTVADQAVDAVTGRLEGGGASHMTLGGQPLSPDTPGARAAASGFDGAVVRPRARKRRVLPSEHWSAHLQPRPVPERSGSNASGMDDGPRNDVDEPAAAGVRDGVARDGAAPGKRVRFFSSPGRSARARPVRAGRTVPGAFRRR